MAATGRVLVKIVMVRIGGGGAPPANSQQSGEGVRTTAAVTMPHHVEAFRRPIKVPTKIDLQMMQTRYVLLFVKRVG